MWPIDMDMGDFRIADILFMHFLIIARGQKLCNMTYININLKLIIFSVDITHIENDIEQNDLNEGNIMWRWIRRWEMGGEIPQIGENADFWSGENICRLFLSS